MLDDQISWTLVGRRFSLFLLGGFALATLLLATAGVYGVISFSTSQRSREFGLRMALGAERRDIIGLVVGEGLKLAGIGVAIGVIVALALFLIVAAACYVPASRALKVDPVEALRVD